MSAASPTAPHAEGVLLAVRITPRGGRNAIDGVGTDGAGRAELRIRLAAPPVDGAANAALIDFLAATLRLRKRDITILSGETGRSKRLLLKGDSAAIAARITEL